MLDLVKSEKGIPVLPDELDRNPLLLNCENGTIDLRTGELGPHRREDLITKLSPVEYNPAADCPIWLEFLDTVLGGSESLIRYVKQVAGYALTGMIREHKLFFLYGGGANGKSTLVGTILSILGEYGRQIDPEILILKRNGSHPTSIADLQGVRFAVCQEVEQGKRMAESIVKQLTGGTASRPGG